MIERASPADRAFLAMDTGEVPEQFGVVLLLGESAGGPVTPEHVLKMIAERVPAVPRLRRRLMDVPLGCGGPVWTDDPSFDPRHHVRTVRCAPPGDEQALLDTALSVIVRPLPRSAPLWSATLVTDVAGSAGALVLVLHHALADGVGGLAVLTRLVDAPEPGPEAAFPRPAPGRAALARDALHTRLAAPRRALASGRQLRASLGAGGGLRPPRAAPTSLNRRTGPRRRLGAVHTDLAAVRDAAHRHGASVNDAVLVAVAGALRRVLVGRGESPDAFVITVPVSGRRPEADSALGNMVSPMLVSVPAVGAVPERLRLVSARVRAHRAAATGPAPIAVLGWLFRPLARLGGYRWYMNHQHRFHTLVTHVRGPAEQVAFGGIPVVCAVPVTVGDGGNVPVHFEVLSYAGTLTLAATADPDGFPELTELTEALSTELDLVTRYRDADCS
ncbi:wax ester/triacylglycerol synthase domain-containing protein [Streptomyces sp. NPDC050803]|uniref:wax ester/triacylglycerol synthase domain-containing protein n=1 Tax=unclassified Streptomyces TaxID=2593676 RepID=UPI003414980C